MMDLLLLIITIDQSAKYSIQYKDSAPPAYFYKNGDLWRNPTVKELEKYEFEETDKILGNG